MQENMKVLFSWKGPGSMVLALSGLALMESGVSWQHFGLGAPLWAAIYAQPLRLMRYLRRSKIANRSRLFDFYAN